MVPKRIESALLVLRGEYLAMPDLALTPAQVAGLVELDRATARVLLDALEYSRFLERTPDGRFTLAVRLRGSREGSGTRSAGERQAS